MYLYVYTKPYKTQKMFTIFDKHHENEVRTHLAYYDNQRIYSCVRSLVNLANPRIFQ